MTTNRLTRAMAAWAFFFAAALSWAPEAMAYVAGGGKDAGKGNDCLIGYQGVDPDQVTPDGNKSVFECIDCDPACDKDGDPTANGSCTFEIGVCINQSGVENCIPPAGLTKAKASAKVSGVKGKIVVEVPQLLEGSVCGAMLAEITVPLKKNGAKDGKGKVSLSAQLKKDKDAGIPKTRKDKDKLSIVCVPRPADEECPSLTTTTTSTSTSTTSSTLPLCGNGTINSGEVCDPAAAPTGCPGGETCILDCTCGVYALPSGGDPTSLTFTTGPGTSDCGSPGFAPIPAATPHAGTLSSTNCTCVANADCGTGGRCADGHCTASTGAPERITCSANTDCAAGQVCEDSTIQLGLGCLYIGAGSSTVPGGVTPDTAPSKFNVDLVSADGNKLVFGGANTGGLDCTVADGPDKVCANGNPGIGGTGACNSDSDCRPNCVGNVCVNGAPGTDGNGTCASGQQCGSGAEGCVDANPDPPDACAGVDGLICVPAPNCYFGPPLPVKNGPLSTCVLNVFDQDVTGTADVAAGSVALTLPLSSRVHFTSTAYPSNPCPTCVAGVCDAGPNKDQPCTGVGVDQTTHDCPPDPFYFLAPLSVTLQPLTTGTAILPLDGSPSPNGLFCPFQGTAGAFTVPSARAIAMQGAPAAGGLDTTAKDAVLASSFCIPVTGNVLIDGAANLPGPGATSLGGTLQLQ